MVVVLEDEQIGAFECVFIEIIDRFLLVIFCLISSKRFICGDLNTNKYLVTI